MNGGNLDYRMDRPTSHRVIFSDWFAAILTQSSCCGSSSALAGHGFWPQSAHTLQEKNKGD